MSITSAPLTNAATGTSPTSASAPTSSRSAADSDTTVCPIVKPPKYHKPRAAWRQRLVLAERGIGNGARQDSIFFVHIFTATMILVVAIVLNIAAWQWMLVAFSLIMLFVAELLRSFDDEGLLRIDSGIAEVPPSTVPSGLNETR